MLTDYKDLKRYLNKVNLVRGGTMSTETEYEYVDISKCPVCGKKHRYKLDVKRSLVMHMLTMSSLNSQEKVFYARFTRIFVCPEKGGEFEAVLTLPYTLSNKIESVSVVGAISMDDEGE